MSGDTWDMVCMYVNLDLMLAIISVCFCSCATPCRPSDREVIIHIIIILKSVCRCSQTPRRNSCSNISGYISNCSNQ